ncbi:MAG TPA: FKBP-type peptidyl-prolyl cis-trans isomerase [Terriglobales bacterium]|jgi:FKBP-type peptidyl-prolyl cis-trans isomerase
MRKPFAAATTLTAAMLLLGAAQAQQPSPPKSTAASATKSKTAAKAPAASSKTTAGTTKARTAMATEREKFSYALGMSLGKGIGGNLHKQAVEFDPSLLAQGFTDAIKGSATRMTDEEAQAVIQQVKAEVGKKIEEKMKAEAAANKQEGEKFLAANKTKEGVVTLPDGLQYKILKEGTGPKPTVSDSVVCNYRGTLINGTEFDSSYKRGQPATFPVSGVIKGWTEALPLMAVGSKWQLFVPAELAYGEGAPGAEIGPNSTLIFEVELLSIQDKKSTAPEQKAPEPEKK